VSGSCSMVFVSSGLLLLSKGHVSLPCRVFRIALVSGAP